MSRLAWSLYKCGALWRAVYGPATELKEPCSQQHDNIDKILQEKSKMGTYLKEKCHQNITNNSPSNI